MNSQVSIHNIDYLLRLADKYQTPLFVYDTSVIESQLNRMQLAFNFKHKIFYSCKALSNPNILKFFKSKGCGLDTVSLEQVHIGLQTGFAPKEILFSPCGTSIKNIETAAELGVQLNFGNLEQLEVFASKNPNTPVFVRFNPNIIAGSSALVSVGHNESKFGIPIDQLSHLLKIIEAFEIQVIGIHVHIGSDIMNTSQLIECIKTIFDVSKHFDQLQFINLGSGFKVKYEENDVETDIEKLGKSLKEEIQKLANDIVLIVEPGKYLVSSAGVLLVQTNVIKNTQSATFAIVNSGFNHLIRPMYYNAFHHIENISNSTGKIKVYNVVGYLGETDTFGWNRKLNEIRENDILMIKNAGAYAYSMSSNYNSRLRPAEVLIHNKKDYLISKRESIEDLNKSVIPLPFEFN